MSVHYVVKMNPPTDMEVCLLFICVCVTRCRQWSCEWLIPYPEVKPTAWNIHISQENSEMGTGHRT
jgi:hypothetical protein